MKRFFLSIFLIVGLLFVCPVLSFANDKQDQADALIARSRQLSDIRASGSPAFHLKASVKLYSEKGQPTEGTYDEYWVSSAQWRREIVLGDFHRVEVAVGNKRWTTDSAEAPSYVMGPQKVLSVWEAGPEKWSVGRIYDKISGINSFTCLETKANLNGRKWSQCFEKTTGAMEAESMPLNLSNGVTPGVCEYTEPQTYMDKIFPSVVRCYVGDQSQLEMRIRLEHLANVPPDLFVHTDSAKEGVNCQGPTTPPEPLGKNSIRLPGIGPPKAIPSLQITVDADGIVRQVKVLRSGGKDVDNAFTDQVRNFRFKPANCDGQPVEAQITF